MITAKTDTDKFYKDMNSIINYSIGFLEGADSGKTKFLSELGKASIEVLKNYIDTSARMNPSMLQHVYEWNRVGSPNSRLFDISYTASNLGLSVKSTFRQSKSVAENSNTPFYNKAMIMEKGIPVTIRPKKANVLVFDVDGETVFSKGPIDIMSPGGPDAQGGFEKIFDEFFSRYFTQAFLMSSGIKKYLEKPEIYKKNISKAKTGGKALGVKTGYAWIAKAGVLNG